MLTSDHKQKHIEWPKKHIDDNWNKTLCSDSDETSFQLFCNTIGWILHKSLFCFRQIIDAKYDTEILKICTY